MKNLLYTLAVIACFWFAACKKHHNPQPDNPYGLPNATQEGKNTLGFLLNGEPWTPKGYSGTANLSIDVDFGFNEGGFGISAYRTINGSEPTYFGIGIKDSLNFISIPNTIAIGINTLAVSRFNENVNCEITFFDTTVFRGGELSITKLDKINRIISGTFNTTLYKPGCSDTIRITQGRFDMKY